MGNSNSFPQFADVQLTSVGPIWRTVSEGVNFEGTCRNSSCQAFNDIVEVQRGFYDSTGGTCDLNYELTQLQCPVCGQTLNKNDVHGIGVYKGKLQMKSQTRGNNEVVVNIEAWNKFSYAGCLNDKDKVNYESVFLKVERFPSAPSDSSDGADGKLSCSIS